MKKIYLLQVIVGILMCVSAAAQPTQPDAPPAGNSANCTQPVSETCIGASTVVTSFKNGTLRSGSPTSLPALYTFYNVAMVNGQQINATVTVESQLNCDMSSTAFSVDDDNATDQNGNSVSTFFAPRITPASNLTTTDVRGYVQFTIRFYVENGTAGEQYPADYATVPPFGGLSGLNYIHYDIDGSKVGTNGWFRETGVVKNVAGSTINADVTTELTSYTYTDNGNWKGFAGSVFERDGLSRCAQTAAAANFTSPQASITMRMGYDYNYDGTSYNQRPTRQFGSRFGCFAFPQQTTLPVKLLSFNGVLKNNFTFLHWEAENQVNFSAYEIQRSTNGVDFTSLSVTTRQGTGMEKEVYQYADNLSGTGSPVFYYRLRMIDIDGKFTYSNVIMIRTDQSNMGGLVISPNPMINGNTATVRFESTNNKKVEFRVVDMSGKVVLRQQNLVQEGANSVAINNLGQVQAGMYILQMADGETVQSVKFTIYHQ